MAGDVFVWKWGYEDIVDKWLGVSSMKGSSNINKTVATLQI